jgi:glycosyltransferase involved in cell wall biosynthesis
MAHGLPICGTDISGIRQAMGVKEGSEWLAAPGDSNALSMIMSRLAIDPELRHSLGAKNQQRIKAHFSPDELADNVLKLIWNFENP